MTRFLTLVLPLLFAGAVVSAKPPARTPAGAPATTTSTARLCYAKKTGIYVSAVDGSGARKWSDVKGVSDPCIAPDGKSIALTMDKSRKETELRRFIGIIKAPDAKPRVLDAIPAENNYGPIWSPDGAWLMFSHYSNDTKWDICVVRRDGSDFRDLTEKLQGKEDMLSRGWWAPDSQSIYVYDFKRFYQVGLDGREIARMPVTDILGDAELSSDLGFSLNTDRNRLLAEAPMEVNDIPTEDGPPSLIFLRDIAAKTMKRVSPKGISSVHPSWIPGENAFTFRGYKDKKFGIYRMEIGASEAKLIVKDADDPSVSH